MEWGSKDDSSDKKIKVIGSLKSEALSQTKNKPQKKKAQMNLFGEMCAQPAKKRKLETDKKEKKNDNSQQLLLSDMVKK